MTDLIFDIYGSKYRTCINFPGSGSLSDKLNFGFSFIESRDEIVSYVVAGPKLLKRIFIEIDDSFIGLRGDIIGVIWTADLIYSNKVREDQIIFSNENKTIVLFLNLNPDRGLECQPMSTVATNVA